MLDVYVFQFAVGSEAEEGGETGVIVADEGDMKEVGDKVLVGETGEGLVLGEERFLLKKRLPVTPIMSRINPPRIKRKGDLDDWGEGGEEEREG